MFASRRGVVASPFLDLNGMDYNSVFDVPVTDDTTAYVGAQGQMSRGMGAGGLILGLRRTVSPHTSWEAAAVTGSMQSAATLAVQRQLSEHSAGTLTYSYSNAQGGLGLEVGVQRQLSAHSKGHLTWNVGPVGGMSTGMQRAKGKNSWKFDFSVGPASTGITGFLARRLSKKSTFRLGFRFGTMAIDVDVGCSRKVNHESSIGMSVSIGVRGVHVKIRFHHSGQRFQFPILITPFVTPTRVLASLTIPTALVLATKRYVVKPAALRARAAEQRDLRRRHARAVAADKAESSEAQALLKSQADKRTAKERDRGGLVIESAVYGHFPRRSRPRPGDPIVEGFDTERNAEGGVDDGDGFRRARRRRRRRRGRRVRPVDGRHRGDAVHGVRLASGHQRGNAQTEHVGFLRSVSRRGGVPSRAVQAPRTSARSDGGRRGRVIRAQPVARAPGRVANPTADVEVERERERQRERRGNVRLSRRTHSRLKSRARVQFPVSLRVGADERIDGDAVSSHLEVQVRSERASRVSHLRHLLPARTVCPTLAFISRQCAYLVSHPSPWSTLSDHPYPASSYERSDTVPLAAALMGVPSFAATSTPACNRPHRGPNPLVTNESTPDVPGTGFPNVGCHLSRRGRRLSHAVRPRASVTGGAYRGVDPLDGTILRHGSAATDARTTREERARLRASGFVSPRAVSPSRADVLNLPVDVSPPRRSQPRVTLAGAVRSLKQMSFRASSKPRLALVRAQGRHAKSRARGQVIVRDAVHALGAREWAYPRREPPTRGSRLRRRRRTRDPTRTRHRHRTSDEDERDERRRRTRGWRARTPRRRRRRRRNERRVRARRRRWKTPDGTTRRGRRRRGVRFRRGCRWRCRRGVFSASTSLGGRSSRGGSHRRRVGSLEDAEHGAGMDGGGRA